MKTAQKKDSPDLMGALNGDKPRRGRPPRQPSKTATQIAAEMEQDARRMLAAAKILRGK